MPRSIPAAARHGHTGKRFHSLFCPIRMNPFPFRSLQVMQYHTPSARKMQGCGRFFLPVRLFSEKPPGAG
jgi:hypothetical protein